jgi:hemoglobin/transferrin/lactoferrin receptor protein
LGPQKRPAAIAEQALRIDLGVDNLTDRGCQPYLSAIDGPGRNIKTTLAWRF